MTQAESLYSPTMTQNLSARSLLCLSYVVYSCVFYNASIPRDHKGAVAPLLHVTQIKFLSSIIVHLETERQVSAVILRLSLGQFLWLAPMFL